MANLDVPETRFAPARGARLAYQTFGAGTEHLVAVPPAAQNVEVCWEHPAIRAMLERFGAWSRFLHFDKRGTGCSDRRSRVADMDERVEDLRAVMDHAGVARAHLLAQSEGGPMTLLFAATYPDRVASVCLVGSGPAIHTARTPEEVAARRELHRRHAEVWGTPESRVAEGFAPSLAAADPGYVAWHQRYERLSASRDSMEDLLELTLHMDVREALPSVQAPTLVLHRTGDRVVPIELGEEAAALIPDARFLAQPGDDHFAYAGDVDAWMDVVEHFVTGEVVPTSAWGSRLARQLCKRLVLARGWPVTRDELFDLLWPEEVDRARLGPRLSVQLSAVRRVFGGGVIADRETVRLDRGHVRSDLDDLDDAAEDDAVVALWAGPLLPEDAGEAWTQGVRAEVAGRCTVAARRVVERALADGDHERVAELAGRLLAEDPWDEAAHRARVASWLAAGATGRAAEAHGAWVEAMDELGVEVPGFDEVVGGVERFS